MPFPAATAPAESIATSPGRSVLVIDDSALIREAAKIALATIAGWRVATADSGEEGIDLAASGKFDAILLDVVMPGLDGLAVAERLDASLAGNAPPIVLLTAHERLQDSERFRRLAVAGVIAKPFGLSDLAREVAAFLEWST